MVGVVGVAGSTVIGVVVHSHCPFMLVQSALTVTGEHTSAVPAAVAVPTAAVVPAAVIPLTYWHLPSVATGVVGVTTIQSH